MRNKKTTSDVNLSTTGVGRRRFLNLTASVAGGMMCMPVVNALNLTRKKASDASVSTTIFAKPPIRYNVKNYPQIEAYADAIWALQCVKTANGSNLYQAFVDIHQTYCGGTSSIKVHGTWFLLPWHRAFLYFFERALQKVAPDNVTISIPYWDWFNDRKIPDAFWTPKLRHKRFLGPKGMLLPESVNICKALQATTWAGFGGDQNAMGGNLDINGPHAAIHSAVGFGCDMGNYATAPMDPIFWSHHANLDRYWNVWLRLKNCQNCDDPKFLQTAFDLIDENGNPIKVSVAQILSLGVYDTDGQTQSDCAGINKAKGDRLNLREIEPKNSPGKLYIRIGAIPVPDKSIVEYKVFLNKSDATGMTSLSSPNYLGKITLVPHGADHMGHASTINTYLNAESKTNLLTASNAVTLVPSAKSAASRIITIKEVTTHLF